ncbi:heme o synthase [Fervidibacillus halotolerans]|uniref:Protoheme IX farnesyltransferase n=1 Tax=Fervidibacillus halotolerans TaxID=2980027 RepID=A0A9E8M010_9BACI|nr:heme o synthase [Fervidibacillus halotolerans]WAA12724.1 heme o synthase [Fervidibacillus halotolerans]
MENKLPIHSNTVVKSSTNQNNVGFVRFLLDLKLLVKGKVLVANVMPVFTGFWLALFFTNQSISSHWSLLFITLVGSTLVISGALMLNNWYEVDLDAKMERTKSRPTVTGHFSLNSVLWMGIGVSVVGFVLMAFTTFEALVYSFLGWFVYVVLYTFWSKRKYTLNTVIGSVSGAFTPLIGWAAIDSAFHTVPIIFAFILFIWQVPHTLAITIKRYEDYRAAGVPMLPVVYGINMGKRVNFVYILSLLPFPIFLLPSMGLIFVIFTILLNLVWIVLALKGFSTDDDYKWAQQNLVFSLNYLFLMFLAAILLT